MNKSLASLVLIGFLTFTGTQSAAAQEKPQQITINEAVSIALKNNPSIKAANLEIQRQESLKKSAFDLDKTDISYSNGQLNTAQTDFEWSVSQDFKFPTVYATQLKLQKEKVALSQASFVLQKSVLERNVRAIYMQLRYAKNRLILIAELEKAYKDFARIAQKRYSTGESNLIEKMAAEGKRETIRLLKQEARLDVENYRKHLKLLLNVKQNISIVESDLQKLSFTDIKKSGDNNPVLKIKQQLIKVSKKQHSLEKSKFLPDLSMGYFNQQIEGVKNFTGFQLGIKVPLFFWSQKGKTQAAKKNNEISRMRYKQTKLDVSAVLQSNLQDYKKYKASLNYYETKGLKLAEKLFSSANKAYKEGEVNYVEYIASLEQVVQIKRDYLKRLNLYNQTLIKINYLTGKYN